MNQYSKNPGEYVPSRFSNYGDAVALGVIDRASARYSSGGSTDGANTEEERRTERVIVLDRDAMAIW